MPVDSLPAEMLEKIFRIACSDTEHGERLSKSLRQLPLLHYRKGCGRNLASVCRLWRRLIENDAMIWKTIMFNDALPSITQEAFDSCNNTLQQHNPCDVHVYIYEREPEHVTYLSRDTFASILEAIKSVCRRIKTFFLSLSSLDLLAEALSLLAINLDGLVLDKLNIECLYHGRDSKFEDTHMVKLGWNAPQLRSLQVSNLPVQWEHCSRWPTLTDLSIASSYYAPGIPSFEWSDLASFLQDLTCLEVLSLSLHQSGWITFPEGRSSRTQCVHPSDASPLAFMFRLNDLTIAASFHDFFDVWNRISAPHLRKLNIQIILPIVRWVASQNVVAVPHEWTDNLLQITIVSMHFEVAQVMSACRLSNVTTMDVIEAAGYGDETWRFSFTLPSLRNLTVRGSAKNIFACFDAPRLRKLILMGDTIVDQERMQPAFFREIKFLALVDCILLYGAGDHIFSRLKKLSQLHLQADSLKALLDSCDSICIESTIDLPVLETVTIMTTYRHQALWPAHPDQFKSLVQALRTRNDEKLLLKTLRFNFDLSYDLHDSLITEVKCLVEDPSLPLLDVL